MIKDLAPISTPKDVLTDCLNGTIITYNGNEFVLQNDMGNCQVDLAKLSPGFIPLGMKEYGGIVYVASLNPETGVCEIGSFPSPQEDFSTTDFGEIGPANFINTDFTLDVGDDSVKERTVKNLKLFEPELMTLHPGDLYVVLYTIHPISPDVPGNEIIDETTYEDFISEDPANRKLFRLVFSKINDNNNLVPLDPLEIKVIPFQVDVSDEYVYFKEPSQAVITVGLEMEQLDTFDAQVVDSSLNTDSNKKVTVSAVGSGNSLATFDGVRVEVTAPSSQTFYLNKQTGHTKVQAVISGLAANDNFQCSVTPYSPYCLYPQLTKNFNLIMGQYLSSGDGVNNLFVYYLDTNSIKVQFDYRFQGNSPDGIHLYVEFYDPWSDYSIIKTVDNPTYYGLNTVILETINEPLVNTFDSVTTGGTPTSKLINNSDTEYEKSLLNSTNLIRSDQVLRLNTFYIVRISGVDQIWDPVGNVFTYQHYDFYKGMYTTDMFNSIYTAQAALSVNDPLYVSDFNALDFDISKVAYQTTIQQTFSSANSAIEVNYPNVGSTDPITGAPITLFPLMTNQNWYGIYPDSAPYTGSTVYKNSSFYQTDAEYSIQLALQGLNYIFGNFKQDLLTVDFPTLLASDDISGSPGFKPTITEPSIPGTPDPNSFASWISTDLGSGLYTVDLHASTNRSIQANANIESKTGTAYKEVPLINSFHAFLDGTGPLTNPYAVLELSQGNGLISADHSFTYVDDSGTPHYVATPGLAPGGGADDVLLYTTFHALTRKYSAYWGSMFKRCNFWWWPGAPGDYGDVHNSNCSDRNNIIFFSNEATGQLSAARVHDIEIAKDMFNTLKVASNVPIPMTLYSPDGSTLTKNGQLKSTFSFKNASIVTNMTPDVVSMAFVKTYLSTFVFHALSSVQTFNPTVINNYIASKIGGSVILDGKQTIRDGFIPFITAVQQNIYQMSFDDIVIDQAASSDQLGAILDGETLGSQDPTFVSLGTYKPHGTLFSADSAKYVDMATTFKVAGFTSGVEIDPNQVYIYLNSARAMWLGYYRIGGTPKYKNAPDLYQEFQYL